MHILRPFWPQGASFIARLAALASLALCAATSHAANLTWSAPTNITGDADVLNGSINGDVTVGAFRFGLPGLTAATVNGVTFQPFAVADNTSSLAIGNFAVNFGASLSSNTESGSTAAPYSNLPPATQSLLQSGTFTQTNVLSLTMSGLVVGTAYTFEWWSNNAGVFTGQAGQRTRATGGTSAVILNNNSYASGANGSTTRAGGVGQFAVGTFTADSTSQVVSFTSPNDFATLNAFQLCTFPEPTTALLAAAGLGLCAGRHHRRAPGVAL